MGFVKVSVSAYSRVFVWFCLIADLRVIASPPRIIKPTAEEIIVQSGYSISLECAGEHFVNWTQNVQEHIDVSDDLFRRWTVRYIISEEDKYPFKALLDLRDASYLDTGYIYCSYNTIDYDDIQSVAKVYVYVNSSTELFALNNFDAEAYKRIDGEPGSQLILPCRPTSPDVEIILLLGGMQIYPPLEELREEYQYTYDPRKGFYLDFAPTHLFPTYQCNATAPYAKRSHTVKLYVLIQAKPVPKPVVENATEFVMKSESITLVCYVKVRLNTEVGLEWIPPNSIARQEDRYRTQNFSNPLSNQYKEPTVRVTIINAQKADEGEYICNASQGENSRQSSIRVEVQDNSTSFIHLNVAPSIVENATFDAQWIVHIVAHPSSVTRIWQKPNGEVINGSSGKFVITDDPKSSRLKISDLHLDDSGVYVFIATNSFTTVQRNLTLYVKDSPEVTFLKDTNDLLETNNEFNLTCTVKAYPKPNITFLFRPCSPVWNCAAGFELLGTNSEEMPTEEMMDHQTVQFKTTGIARQSGQYVCIACNPGCRYDTKRVVVSDVPEGFQLTTTTEFPAESDGVSLACSVTLFKYRKEITWFYEDENGNEDEFYGDHGSFELFSSRSSESYTETLKFSSIELTDSGSYVCQATDLNYNDYNATPVKLKVLAKVPPVILNVSHPEGKIETYAGDKVEIKCVATGVPQPKAEWWKDDDILENFQTEGNTSFVTFESVKEENAGSYVCRYSSGAGEQQRTFKLRVKANKPVQAEIIVGVVLVGIVFVALLIALLYKIREDKKREGVWNVKQLQDLLSGNIECMNPELGIDEQAELLPYDKQWEFRRDHLKLGKQLGSGAFGRVLKGVAMGITTNEAITIVAVKMVKSHANYSAFEALLAELKIMIHLGSHLNVVNLLGACTANITKCELLVIVEYCKYGNLRDYLIKNRENFIDQINPATGQLDPNIGLDQIQKFAFTWQNSVCTNDTCYSAGSPNPCNSRNRLPVSTSPPSGIPVGSYGECATLSGTEATFPEDSTGQSVGIDSTGTQMHAPMRSNCKGDFRDTAGPIRTKDLICWSFQIARGMEYLASRKVLHGDLAARNILLAENNVAKICDFGLARELYKNGSSYKKKSDGPLPVKWMAIESITDLVFSTQSDVWSFGIVLWEMFSLGNTPYPDLQADEVFFRKLKAGYRMERPTYATAEIYDVMMDCWRTDPCLRPSFTILQEMLGELLEESVRCNYIELNSPYNLLNTERRKQDYVDMVGRPDYANVASAPVCSSGPYNAERPSTSPTPGVGNSSTGQAERLSVTGAGYLFMASSAKSQTPDVFSLKGNLPKSSVGLALKLPKVDEESFCTEEISSKTKSYPKEKKFRLGKQHIKTTS